MDAAQQDVLSPVDGGDEPLGNRSAGARLLRVDWREGPEEDFVVGVPSETTDREVAYVHTINATLGWDKFRLVPAGPEEESAVVAEGGDRVSRRRPAEAGDGAGPSDSTP